MKLLYSDDSDTHCIILNNKEAQDLCTALQFVTGEWEGPRPRKNSRVFKIADCIADNMYVW